ncbi:hypothetical protein NGRA_3354, partial [Nosema granulosis]
MLQFGKLFLRFSNPKKPPGKKEVFEVLQKRLEIPLTGIREVKDGFNVFTEREHDVEKMLTDTARAILNQVGLVASLPPEIRAQRSVICRQIDCYVGGHSSDELKEEIERSNRNLEVSEVIKFKNYTHIFKVEFASSEKARSAVENGFLCCHMKISSSQIEQEKYIDLLMCFNCYSYEDHLTKDCPTPDVVRCSECSGPHNFRDCREETKKCLNCKGAHRTMAMSCPVKKDLIKKKLQQKEEDELTKQESTYARVVTKALSTAQQQQQASVTEGLMAETGMRALVMILDAHVQNIIAPGSYNEHLNKTLKANNIQPIVFDPN